MFIIIVNHLYLLQSGFQVVIGREDAQKTSTEIVSAFPPRMVVVRRKAHAVFRYKIVLEVKIVVLLKNRLIHAICFLQFDAILADPASQESLLYPN